MNKVSWTIFSVLAIGILVILAVFSKQSTSINVNDVDIYAVQTASATDGNIGDHIFGKTGSKVTMIEYGDYQCPACAKISPTFDSVENQYKNQVQFIFRNFPLTTIHQNAKAAAAAAEAAGKQGKFWEMHSLLYEKQDSWSELNETDRMNFFVDQAKSLGLNTDKFKTDMASSSIAKKIDYDTALGQKTGVQGTPSFYLNGKQLTYDQFSSEDKLKDTLNAELKKAGIPLP